MLGRPYAPIPNSESSLKKQAPIGRVFMLATEHNITPYSAPYNQGVANPQGAFTDLERLAHEHGYGGVLQRNTQMPMAAVFGALPVRKIT